VERVLALVRVQPLLDLSVQKRWIVDEAMTAGALPDASWVADDDDDDGVDDDDDKDPDCVCDDDESRDLLK
jgi:hypothetical protein